MSIKAAFMVPHPPLIVNEIGGSEIDKIKTTLESYERVAKEIGELKPDTIIISTPHIEMYSNYFHCLQEKRLIGSFKRFGAPNVSFDFENDLELVSKIEDICIQKGFPGVLIKDDEKELDHGSMVPLYFIRKYLKDFKLIVVSLSTMPYTRHYELGQIIKKSVEELNRDAVFVASGDLSHKLQEYGPYGFVEEGPIYDKKIMEIMSKGDFIKLLEFDDNLCEKAAVCGHRSFIIMSGTLDHVKVKSTMLSHEDVTGVGYGLCTYYPDGESEDRLILDKYLNNVKNELNEKYKNSSEYVKLARKTIFEYIKNGKIIDIDNNISSELLNQKAGVFVSIHKLGNLRGCIGTILPVKENIAEEIIDNAISAATRDNRFKKITTDELDYLDINVDVLTSPEPIKSKDELNVKKYGVIVSSGYKRGLLLPDLDGIDNIDQQVRIAAMKGNIDLDKEEYKLERFEVKRYK